MPFKPLYRQIVTTAMETHEREGFTYWAGAADRICAAMYGAADDHGALEALRAGLSDEVSHQPEAANA